MHTQRTLRVLVAVRDVEESDRLAGELAEIGFETAAVFSGPEAIGALHVESFDALVIDASLEEGAQGLRRWLQTHFRGVVCFLHDAEGLLSFEEEHARARDGGDARGRVEAAEVVGRLLRLLTAHERLEGKAGAD